MNVEVVFRNTLLEIGTTCGRTGSDGIRTNRVTFESGKIHGGEEDKRFRFSLIVSQHELGGGFNLTGKPERRKYFAETNQRRVEWRFMEISTTISKTGENGFQVSEGTGCLIPIILWVSSRSIWERLNGRIGSDWGN